MIGRMLLEIMDLLSIELQWMYLMLTCHYQDPMPHGTLTGHFQILYSMCLKAVSGFLKYHPC